MRIRYHFFFIQRKTNEPLMSYLMFVFAPQERTQGTGQRSSDGLVTGKQGFYLWLLPVADWLCLFPRKGRSPGQALLGLTENGLKSDIKKNTVAFHMITTIRVLHTTCEKVKN